MKRLASIFQSTSAVLCIMAITAFGAGACSSSAAGTDGGGEGTGGNNVGGPSTVTNETLRDALHSSLTVGDDVAWMGESDDKLVASAVLEASMQATGGNSFRFYGTLTQQGTSNSFSYSDQPQDKLVLAMGSGQVIDIVVHSLDGYTQGTMDDFLDAHEMDYNIASADVVDIHVISSAKPNGNDVTKKLTVQGKAKSGSDWLQIDMTRSRQQHEEVDVDWAKLQRTDDYAGTITGPAGTVHLSERDGFTYQAFKGTHVRNFSIESHSSFDLAGRSFTLQNMYLQWEDGTVFNGGRNEDQNRSIVVSEPGYWQAKGTLLEGGNEIGQVGFSGPVVAGSKGPDIVMTLQDGATIQILRPIERP